MSRYTAGMKVRASAAFYDNSQVAASAPAGTNGPLVDPSVVYFVFGPRASQPVVDPDTAALTTWSYYGFGDSRNIGSIVRDGVGLYHADIDTTSVQGEMLYRFSSTGVGQAIAYSGFIVDPSPV